MKRILLIILFSVPLWAQSTTPNLGMTWPPHGAANWDTNVIANSVIVDNVFGIPNCSLIGWNSATKLLTCPTTQFTFIVNHNSSSTAQATVEFMGSGSGSIAGAPSLVDIVTEDATPWALTIRNKSASPAYTGAFFMDAQGNFQFLNTDPTNTNSNGIVFKANGDVFLNAQDNAHFIKVTGLLQLLGQTGLLPVCTDVNKGLTTTGCTALSFPGVTDDGITFSFSGTGGFSGNGFTATGTGTGLYAVNGSASGSCTWTTTATGTAEVFDCPSQFPSYTSTTNCSGLGTGASPSVVTCASAPAGSFSCATAATGATCVVNTTTVTANSQIFVQEDETLGTKLGVTCNTGTTVIPTSRLLAARSAGVSFTINLGTVTTNPACFSYFIVN